MCKRSNAFSLPVLIGREAWPHFFSRMNVFMCLQKRTPAQKEKTIFGGDGEEATPVSIPNTEVKLFSADGTARETEWESRTPPKIFFKYSYSFAKPAAGFGRGLF
jgi:hypothetical protein